MKRLLSMVLIGLMLCGCAGVKSHTGHRVVTGVQVRYQQQDRVLERTYSKTASIGSILNYLRILDAHGPVKPVGNADTFCRITLQYSQGPDRIYLQQGQQYLRQDDGDWQTINSARASLLYGLLLLLPSD